MPDPLFEEFGDGFKVTLYRKVSNASEKVSNASEKVSNAFEKYENLFKEAKITEKYVKSIQQVFAEAETSMVFGQANVIDWLKCSKSKATNIIKEMKKAKVIEKVSGFGPGKYKFIEK